MRSHMTHLPETVQQVLGLREQGLGARRVSASTGIPISTVADWLKGKAPTTRSGRCDGSCVDRNHVADIYPYLLGLYLGDGCISSHPRTYKLRIKLDFRYPDLVAECERAMQALMPSNKVGRVVQDESWVEVYCYSRHWPCLFPQHGLGRKHHRRIDLRLWQWQQIERNPGLLLRGLIHSDGCRFTNTGRAGWSHPRYSFSNRSEDIRDIFCDTLGLLDLRWSEAPHTIYVSRKDDVARLDAFVGPKT